jgi:hypothetical protein
MYYHIILQWTFHHFVYVTYCVLWRLCCIKCLCAIREITCYCLFRTLDPVATHGYLASLNRLL